MNATTASFNTNVRHWTEMF